MPYAIKMPDGSTIRGIPDNVDGKTVVKRWKAKWVEDNYTETPDLSISMEDIERVGGKRSNTQNALAGVGQGMTNIARNIGNITGIVSDEEMADTAQQDAPLLSTGAGMAGSIAGEVAALAPLGGVGMGARALQAASKAPKLVRGLSKSRALALGTEGAAGGAIAAGPNNRARGATIGALAGGGFGAVSDVSSLLGKGAVKVSPEGAAMEKSIGQELPLSMVASDDGVGAIAKWVYGEAMPFLPGTSSLNKQIQAADDAIAKTALKMSTPEKMVVSDIKGLEKAFTDGYKAVLSSRTVKDVDALPLVGMSTPGVRKVQSIISKYATDGNLAGLNIAKARQALIEMTGKSNMPGMGTVVEQFDNHVLKFLQRGTNFPRAINKADKAANDAAIDLYTRLNAKYDNWGVLADAALKKGGASTSNIADSARKMAPTGTGVSRTGPMQAFSEQGTKLIGKGLPNPSLWGRIASMAALTGGAVMGGAGIAAPALVFGAGKGMASRGTQRAILGRTGLQKAVKKVRGELRPEAGSLASQSLVQQKLEEENL